MKPEDLHIEEPCHENWAAMEDRGARRFCDACVKEVHDLSMLTEEEAQEMMARGGDICIRYTTDDQDKILFRDETSPMWRLHKQIEGAARLLMATASVALLTACEPAEPPQMAEATPAIVIEQGKPATLSTPTPPTTPAKPQNTRVEIPGWLLTYLSTESAKAHTTLTAYLNASTSGPEYHGNTAVDAHVQLHKEDVPWLKDYLASLPAHRRPTLLLDESTRTVPVTHDPHAPAVVATPTTPPKTGSAILPTSSVTHTTTVQPTKIVTSPVIKPAPKHPRMGRMPRRKLMGKIKLPSNYKRPTP